MVLSLIGGEIVRTPITFDVNYHSRQWRGSGSERILLVSHSWGRIWTWARWVWISIVAAKTLYILLWFGVSMVGIMISSSAASHVVPLSNKWTTLELEIPAAFYKPATQCYHLWTLLPEYEYFLGSSRNKGGRRKSQQATSDRRKHEAYESISNSGR